jgi:hypothetical protein
MPSATTRLRFDTANRSSHTGQAFKPGTSATGSGEHRRPSASDPNEIIRLGPGRPIVMDIARAPYLLDRRLPLRTAFAGRFDPNPALEILSVHAVHGLDVADHRFDRGALGR